MAYEAAAWNSAQREQQEAISAPLEQRLADHIGLPADDPTMQAALADARAGNWTTVTAVAGEFAGDYGIASDREQLDKFFGELPRNAGMDSALAAIHKVSEFNGETIPAKYFYGDEPTSRAWARELVCSGRIFAVTGSKEAIITGTSAEHPYDDDPVYRLWIPMTDDQGALPGYRLLTAHAENPVLRAELGKHTYVDCSTVLTPNLQTFGPQGK